MNGTAHSIRSISSSVLLLLAISAHAATVWDGPTISFTKSNYANPLLAENQDRLTANVWITRGSSQGPFNANTESRFTHFLSPAGTEWANGSLENYATLRYTNWNHWAKGVNPNPYATVGVQAVLHLIADDIYLSVQFTSWTGGAPGGGPSYGGGFSYLRSTPLGQPTNITWTGADPSGYWSAPANWSPAGVPVNGNHLLFPGGLPPGDMVSTNDLTNSFFRSISFLQAGGHTIRGNPITLTNRSDCIINSGTNVIACDLTFTGTPSTPTFGAPSIRPSGFPGGELTVIGNVGGGSLRVAGVRVVIRGQFTGGSLRLFATTVALYGDNPHAVSADVEASTLLVQGSQPNLNITMLREMESASCPYLSGNGVVGDVGGCGYITPDSTLSVKNLGLSVLDIHLNGTNVGEYGRLVASGNVSLGSGRLLPSPGFNPQAGQIYTIVEKTSPGVIANEFLGPEGTVTTLNGMPFRISYIGGDGNDVTLTVEATNTVNVQPTVSIISPTNGAIVAAPFGGTIQANAADSDGTVVRVNFFSDAALVGSVSNAPFHLAVTNIAAGTHVLFAVATDDRGATKRSATVTATVVTPVPIVLGAVQWSFGTQFVFSYSANVGLRYAVERGATLSNWTTIRSNTANANPMTVTDTAATNWMNLYRVRLLPNP